MTERSHAEFLEQLEFAELSRKSNVRFIRRLEFAAQRLHCRQQIAGHRLYGMMNFGGTVTQLRDEGI